MKPAEEKPPTPPDGQQYELRLYITGTRPQSLRAIQNLKAFCKTHLEGRHHLEVIDLYRDPAQAAEAQVIAAPTLVKTMPLPVRRMIGDMSNTQQVSNGLDIQLP